MGFDVNSKVTAVMPSGDGGWNRRDAVIKEKSVNALGFTVYLVEFEDDHTTVNLPEIWLIGR